MDRIAWPAFLDRMHASLKRHDLLDAGAGWVVGVSGGPDSTLLVHGLKALAERDSLGWKLQIAHLHHGLRGAEADADAAFVEDLAARLAVPFHSERADIRGQVESEGGSVEEVGRKWRYEFLERVALTTGSARVAVGHNADDNAETVLHRVFRGTGLRGLAGMPETRPIQPRSSVLLVRPLLDFRREEIEQLCAAQGILARVDSTNTTLQFTRGRIRNEILPAIRNAINPNASEAVLRLAEQARWLGTYLEDGARRTFESLVVSEAPGEIVLNTNALLSKQRIIQAEVVRVAVSISLAREQDLTFAHIESVLKLAAEKTSGKEVHLPGPVVVKKVYERLVFGPLASEIETGFEFAPLIVSCPGTTTVTPLRAELLAEVRDFNAADINFLRTRPHPNEEWLDYERLTPPLILRNPQPGDRFWPLGAPGAKTISDFFSDVKVDPAMRGRSGVLCDQNGPVWVIPLRIDERVKLRPTTRRVLRLVMRPLSGVEAAGP